MVSDGWEYEQVIGEMGVMAGSRRSSSWKATAPRVIQTVCARSGRPGHGGMAGCSEKAVRPHT